MANDTWGQAHANNTIGFGQGEINSDNGWGDIYRFSHAGDTNLRGYKYDALVMEWEIPGSAAGVSKNWAYGSSVISNRNFTIDWGDGTVEDKTGVVYFLTHTYAAAGTYTVQIYNQSGDGAEVMRFGSGGADYTGTNNMITDIKQWPTDYSIDSYQKMFFDCDNIGVITARNTPDLSGTRFLTSMFENSGTSIQLNETASYWDTSNVIDMRYMFKYTRMLNNGFDVSKWSITGLTAAKGATNMFLGYSNESDWAISTENYDKLLIGWGAQAGSVNTGVNFSAGSTKYTGGGEAAAGRAALVAAGWVITDGGTV